MSQTLGRPSEFTQEIAVEICARLAEGMSLRSICLADDMPGLRTVIRWRAEREDFRRQYALAREDQADTMADELVEIADDGTNDWMANNDPDNPGYDLNGEHIQRSRLRVDARKWAASKLKPKAYGDKLDTTNQTLDKNGNPTDPVVPSLVVTIAQAKAED